MAAHGTAQGDKHVKELGSHAVTKAQQLIHPCTLRATSCVVLLHAAQCTRLRPQTALDEAPLPRRAAGVHSSLCNGRQAGFCRQAQGHHLQVSAAARVMGTCSEHTKSDRGQKIGCPVALTRRCNLQRSPACSGQVAQRHTRAGLTCVLGSTVAGHPAPRPRQHGGTPPSPTKSLGRPLHRPILQFLGHHEHTGTQFKGS